MIPNEPTKKKEEKKQERINNWGPSNERASVQQRYIIQKEKTTSGMGEMFANHIINEANIQNM